MAPTAAWTTSKAWGRAPLGRQAHSKGTPRVRVGSAAGGLGAESMALQSLGVPHELLFAVEKDEDNRVWLREQHPNLPFCDNLTGPAFETAPPCDLFVMGLACQPYSHLNMRIGFDDFQGCGNWDAIMGYIARCKPRCILMEHSPVLLGRHVYRFAAAGARPEAGVRRRREALLSGGAHGVGHTGARRAAPEPPPSVRRGLEAMWRSGTCSSGRRLSGGCLSPCSKPLPAVFPGIDPKQRAASGARLMSYSCTTCSLPVWRLLVP